MMNIFKVTEKRLLAWRKWMILLAALFTVSTVINLYILKIVTVSILIQFIFCLTLFVFSTKCETLYLKIKLEKSLEKMEVA